MDSGFRRNDGQERGAKPSSCIGRHSSGHHSPGGFFNNPLRGSGLPRGKPDRGRAVCAKADVVGGNATEILPPPIRFRVYTLTSSTPPQGGSESGSFIGRIKLSFINVFSTAPLQKSISCSDKYFVLYCRHISYMKFPVRTPSRKTVGPQGFLKTKGGRSS